MMEYTPLEGEKVYEKEPKKKKKPQRPVSSWGVLLWMLLGVFATLLTEIAIGLPPFLHALLFLGIRLLDIGLTLYLFVLAIRRYRRHDRLDSVDVLIYALYALLMCLVLFL